MVKMTGGKSSFQGHKKKRKSIKCTYVVNGFSAVSIAFLLNIPDFQSKIISLIGPFWTLLNNENNESFITPNR